MNDDVAKSLPGRSAADSSIVTGSNSAAVLTTERVRGLEDRSSCRWVVVRQSDHEVVQAMYYKWHAVSSFIRQTGMTTYSIVTVKRVWGHCTESAIKTVCGNAINKNAAQFCRGINCEKRCYGKAEE